MSYPNWFVGQKCIHCNENLRYCDYIQAGFYLKGPEKGRMFFIYECENCEENGVLAFGDNNYTMEKLCTVVIEESNLMNDLEKIQWKRKNAVHKIHK